MMKKLENFEYDTFAAFEYDMNLVFKNCMIYNDIKTPYYKAAQKLQQSAQAQLDSLRTDSRIIAMDRETCTVVPRDGMAETIFSPYVNEEDERMYLEGMGDVMGGRLLDSSATSVAGDIPEMIIYKMGKGAAIITSTGGASTSGSTAVGNKKSVDPSANCNQNNNTTTLSPVEEATKEDVSPTGTGGSSLEAVSVESELTEFSSRAASGSPGRSVLVMEEAALAHAAAASGTSSSRRQAKVAARAEAEGALSSRSSPRKSHRSKNTIGRAVLCNILFMYYTIYRFDASSTSTCIV